MQVRVFYTGTKMSSREHRLDETYTDDNIPLSYKGLSCVVKDLTDFYDAKGEIPFEACSLTASKNVKIDTAKAATLRQAIVDRTKGMGGRRDTLDSKLKDDSATLSEIKELLRLERGL
jgi:hypothetical protein